MWVGVGWCGLVWVAVGWCGLVWVGVGCCGLVWVGVGWCGCVGVNPDSKLRGLDTCLGCPTGPIKLDRDPASRSHRVEPFTVEFPAGDTSAFLGPRCNIFGLLHPRKLGPKMGSLERRLEVYLLVTVPKTLLPFGHSAI